MDASLGLELTLLAFQNSTLSEEALSQLLAQRFCEQKVTLHPLSQEECAALLEASQKLCLEESLTFLTPEQQHSLVELQKRCAPPSWSFLDDATWRIALGLWVTTLEWAYDIQLEKVENIQEVFCECPLLSKM